ncbi:hypothetical protein [Halomonas sp. RA08-2]|uniref:hypothetical protein n=1 Tax=Halomonas sp. RA08-2 TaxID=3440842 RepID=UPI003F495C6B
MSHKEHAATCWIVAGPNGAGKTTFALNYLPQVANCSRFINADLIAAGLGTRIRAAWARSTDSQ